MTYLSILFALCLKLYQQRVLLIVPVIILTGCTSISTTVRETQGHLNQWISQPVTQMIENNGLPDEVIDMDNKSISHIKNEAWDSSYGVFTANDTTVNAREWNDHISAWILVYRSEEQGADGNYYACTQTYHVNQRGIIIGIKEGWVSPDSQSPCYIKYIKDQPILTVRTGINFNTSN